MNIRDIQKKFADKEASVVDVCEYYRKRIQDEDGTIRAFLEVFEDAKEQSGEAQRILDSGTPHSLTGVPLAMKDNILIEGRSASAASRILEGYIAPYSATVSERIKEQGGIFMGRTNMDEFAMGGSTEHSAFAATANPHDTERVPGGSSGGSAAAVAAGLVPAALGSDTGGSIRQPAAFCGVVGLKPTYGAVSRFGLMAMGSSLDQIGPLTRTVTDAEVVFNAIAGEDAQDSTTYPDTLRKEKGRTPKRIGVPWHLIEQDGVDEDVRERFKEAVNELEQNGYDISDVTLPHFEYTLSAYYVLMQAEVSSNMARFDGMRYGAKKEGDSFNDDYMKTRTLFGKEVKQRILGGTYVLSSGYSDTYYNKAYTVRRLAVSDLEQVFNDEKGAVDALALPTTPTPAFKKGERLDDPLQMYMADMFTVPANIAGIPALSIPAGYVERDKSKLPLGLQLMAPWRQEQTLFSIGKSFMKETYA